MDHNTIMKTVLGLARKGRGRVSPNPLVGSVVIKDGRILAKGYHHFFGGDHAEADALKQLPGSAASGADLYVNLEPCSHTGKTPPCTEIIIKCGIRRVFVGMRDPNPLVCGRGIDTLRRAGITVIEDVLKEECRRLNEPFIKYITQKNPYITLKTAQTLDGRLAAASGRSRWITCSRSRQKVQLLRSEHDAVLIGIQTLLADDSRLNVRTGNRPDPMRIILDAGLRFPLHCRMASLAHPEKTVIVTSQTADPERAAILGSRGFSIWRLPAAEKGGIDLPGLLETAAQHGITSILVEGGRKVFTSFMKANICDRLITFISPKLFGTGMSVFGDLDIHEPEDARRFAVHRWFKCGEDIVSEGRFHVYGNN